MCNCEDCCSCGTTLPIGNTGANGTNGTNGSNGLFGGWSDKWIFNDGNTAFPAATTIRLDTADPSTTTHIYINKTDANSIDVHSFLDSFNNDNGYATNKYGWIRLFKEYDSTLFSYHKITGVSITGDVYDFAVDSTATDKTTPYVAGINMVVTFTPQSKESNTLDYSYATDDNLYITKVAGIGSANKVCYFIYEGNTYHGTKMKDISIVYANSLANSMVVSVYDETNSLVLGYATITSTSTNPPTLITLTKFNDSSVTRSLCSVNILLSPGQEPISTYIDLYALSITFE